MAIEELTQPPVTVLPDELRETTVFMNGPTHPELGKRVARLLGLEVVPVTYKHFGGCATLR